MESTTPANLDIDGKDGNGELDTQSVIIDEETNKRLLRKIDIRLMPVVRFLTCFLLFPHTPLLSLETVWNSLQWAEDVLYVCAPILRQGAPEPGRYLRASRRFGPSKRLEILVGVFDLLFWLHGRLLPGKC